MKPLYFFHKKFSTTIVWFILMNGHFGWLWFLWVQIYHLPDHHFIWLIFGLRIAPTFHGCNLSISVFIVNNQSTLTSTVKIFPLFKHLFLQIKLNMNQRLTVEQVVDALHHLFSDQEGFVQFVAQHVLVQFLQDFGIDIHCGQWDGVESFGQESHQCGSNSDDVMVIRQLVPQVSDLVNMVIGPVESGECWDFLLNVVGQEVVPIHCGNNTFY